MAQTRRKRRTKHRGNAAGVVEARGRTGRKPTAAERGGKGAPAARTREKRLERYDRPPTWRAAFTRAMIAAVALLLISLLLLKQPAQAIGLFPVVLGAYTLISYYTDMWLYRRRQRSKERAKRGQTR
jgi:Flp pilus assembly protein TadB